MQKLRQTGNARLLCSLAFFADCPEKSENTLVVFSLYSDDAADAQD